MSKHILEDIFQMVGWDMQGRMMWAQVLRFRLFLARLTGQSRNLDRNKVSDPCKVVADDMAYGLETCIGTCLRAGHTAIQGDEFAHSAPISTIITY